MDLGRGNRKRRRCSMICVDIIGFIVSLIVAACLRASGRETPVIQHTATPAWVLANATAPATGACWEICEFEFFGDDDCTKRLYPFASASSNILSAAFDS